MMVLVRTYNDTIIMIDMLMMMMLNYVNLLVEYDSMSVSILSEKDNYYTFIPSSYVFIGGEGDGDIYTYIYGYNLFVILYYGVVLVWKTVYRHLALSIVCRVSSYLKGEWLQDHSQ